MEEEFREIQNMWRHHYSVSTITQQIKAFYRNINDST